MTIKKYQGKTKEEAIENAKAELGPRVVIMNVKEVHPNGFLGIFKKSTYEVTAAVEDEFVPTADDRAAAGLSRAENDSLFSSPQTGGTDSEVPSPAAGSSSATRQAREEEPQYSYTRIEDMDFSSDRAASAESRAPRAAATDRAGQGAARSASARTAGQGGFDAVVDDAFGEATHPVPKTESARLSENDLRSAFREVNEVIRGAEHISASDIRNNDSDSPVIKRNDAPKPPEEKRDRAPAGNPVRLSSASAGREPSKSASQAVERQVSARTASADERQALSGVEAGKRRPERAVGANSGFVRMLYNVLMDHEVDERYVNRIISEMGNIVTSENSLDYLISSVYQKMVLLLGSPNPVQIPEKRPLVCFFVGPTGVGKTTTIAKIASHFSVEKRAGVAMLTADTYRIAATKQLKVYADILGLPISVVYTPEDIGSEIEKVADKDLILVDTVGFSHKNEEQRENLKHMLECVPEDVNREIYLVLSATTKYQDLKEIIDSYSDFCDFTLIFTKLDETEMYGNILNARLYSGRALSYVTTGQSVPDDIEEIDMQKLTKLLLGGNTDGSGRTPQKRRKA